MNTVTVKNRILVSICHEGPASRAELAKRFGLSASHICEAVSGLVEQGVLIESGYRIVKKARGRKNTLLDFNDTYKFAIGIGYADNVLSVGLTTVKGDVLGKESVHLDDSVTKDEIFTTSYAITMRLLKDSCLQLSSVLGIGLCIKRNAVERFYPEKEVGDILDEVHDFSELPAVFDPAEDYLGLDERIADIRPEGLYLFGAAKVIRDLLLYSNL